MYYTINTIRNIFYLNNIFLMTFNFKYIYLKYILKYIYMYIYKNRNTEIL